MQPREGKQDTAMVRRLLTRGAKCLAAGQLDECQGMCGAILQKVPDHPDALEMLGLVQLGRRDFAAAIANLRAALRRQPGHAMFCNNLGVALMESGDLDAAGELFARAVKLKADYADAHSNLGLVWHKQGRFETAVRSCRSAIAADPRHAGAHYNLANSLYAAGDTGAAIEHYEEAIRLVPKHVKALNNLANVLQLTHRREEAKARYQEAIRAAEGDSPIFAGRKSGQSPGCGPAYKNLGLIHLEDGQLDEAVKHFQAAIDVQPTYLAAHNDLGIALCRHGRFDDAIASYRRALGIDPKSLPVRLNLAHALLQIGLVEEAAAEFDAVLQRDPLSADAHCGLAQVYRAQERLGEAAASLRRALEIDPDRKQADRDLTSLLHSARRLPEAVDGYLRQLEGMPDNAALLTNLAAAYKDMGCVAEAADAYGRIYENKQADPLLELRLAALCPPVAESNDAIESYLGRLDAAMDRCREARFTIDLKKIAGLGLEPPFLLTYLGRDVRPIKEKYAAVFQGRFPEFEPRPTAGRPKIGIVVTKGHEGIFLRDMGGYLNHADTQRVQTTVVCSESGLKRIRDAVTNETIEYLAIPDRFDEAVRRIRDARFDLLYYWEVASDSFNYFLPFLRLAPVQCTGFGVQATTGIANVDYYVSSVAAEIDGAVEHYSERLHLLDALPTYMARSTLPGSPLPRGAFGLSASDHIYFCPQNLFKYHPDFDPLVAEILRRDPRGKFVGIAARYENITASLRARLRQTMPDVSDRVVLVPPMKPDRYLNLVALADVMLDPVHFGGVNTTYDAFSLKKPIVILPSEHQRGRYTLGCYRQMEVMDAVASSPEQYVDLALQLATDDGLRRSVSDRLDERGDRIFDDLASVRATEDFFENAITAARR